MGYRIWIWRLAVAAAAAAGSDKKVGEGRKRRGDREGKVLVLFAGKFCCRVRGGRKGSDMGREKEERDVR